MNTAIDVSSTWTKFPRYGYVADYPSSLTSSNATHDMWLLKNYHIDGVQFYDWQWKHHVPLAGSVSSPASSWENINGSINYASAVDDYIDAAHYYGMSAMKLTSIGASPDTNNGRMVALPFSTGSNGGGRFVQFTLPSLAYWDMV